MTAIIRIKRNCTEDPLEAVLINCKKRKVEDSVTEVDPGVSTVLNFAGTVTDTDENVLKHIQRLTKTDAEKLYKNHKTDVIEKLRLENQISSRNSRYKIVNSHRFSKADLEESADLDCTIVDVESAERNNTEGNSSSYVYDLYYTNSDDFGETDLNELTSVYPLSEGLVYGSVHDNGYNYPESDYSEDSNAENHWKNDYPDESDVDFEDPYEDDSVDEDALDGMKKISLLPKEDVSSEDFEDDGDYENCDESCTP